MVFKSAVWYIISIISSVISNGTSFDFYFFFDDLFMVSTAFSMFYSWQIYLVEMTTADTGGKPSESTADENNVIHIMDAPLILYDMQR